MAEITALRDLAKWREGPRVLVRRQRPHPGANYDLLDPHGPVHQAPITNSQDSDIAYLVADHRLHAPEEDPIKDAKDCGLANFPCHSIRANQVWLFLVQLAQTLLCWAKRLCLGPDFLLAPPKRLRLQALQVAGRLAHFGRRTILRLGANWPWPTDLELAFRILHALPVRPCARLRLAMTERHQRDPTTSYFEPRTHHRTPTAPPERACPHLSPAPARVVPC